METTFITIHDLSLDARILYASNSIEDILGYRPEEVVNKSCWEYFHPDEIPFARAIHGRGIELDKAAVLNYCQIKSKRNHWVGCECVFTVVNDVLLGCTSVYRQGERSLRRAANAPVIRQLFSSSPRDPRYHMLSYISPKFAQGPKPHAHEPRAAMFLNRFSRTMPIMYATNGLENLLGITAAELRNKSFYYCIQENCLPEAIRCLESAKANDSIAYLRFWFRNPRQDDWVDQDETMSDAPSTDNDDDEGGVQLTNGMETDSSDYAIRSTSSGFASSQEQTGSSSVSRYGQITHPSDSSGSSTNGSRLSAIFDNSNGARSSASSLPGQIAEERNQAQPIELEAVVSCTSDGLVVVLRKARPFVLDSIRQPARIAEPLYKNGLFASPWASEPIWPEAGPPRTAEFNPEHRVSDAPRLNGHGQMMDLQKQGPSTEELMNSIREVAVFAWALTGINGSLAQYSRGTPMPGAQPYGGMPVWQEEVNTHDVEMRMDDRPNF